MRLKPSSRNGDAQMPHSRLLTAANRLRRVTEGLSDPRDIQVVQGYLSDLERLARCELAIVDVSAETRDDQRRERTAVLSAMLKQVFGVSHKAAFLDLLSDLDAKDDTAPRNDPRRLS